MSEYDFITLIWALKYDKVNTYYLLLWYFGFNPSPSSIFKACNFIGCLILIITRIFGYLGYSNLHELKLKMLLKIYIINNL